MVHKKMWTRSPGMGLRSIYVKKLVSVPRGISATMLDNNVLNVTCMHDVSYLTQFEKKLKLSRKVNKFKKITSYLLFFDKST